jgi:SAM-dependent methyltransferase
MPQRIHYDTNRLIAESAGRAHITDVLEAIQREYAVSGKQVVELGSGIGTNLAVFAGRNSVLGVEGLEAAAAESRKRGIATIVGNVEHAVALPDKSADWILCIDVLEHLFDPAQCLLSVRRILRDDGYLLVNVPNHFDWHGRLRVLCGSGIDSQRYFVDSPHWEYPHVRFFSRHSIDQLLAACGFNVAADFGSKFVSFPKVRIWKSLGMSPLLHALQSHWPDLFSSGFFLLCTKQ